METTDIDNLNRTELLEELKGKCKKRSVRVIYEGLITLLLVIVIFIIFAPQPSQYVIEDIIFIIFIVVYSAAYVWSFLCNYRFKKKIDTIDTPDQLLCEYEKITRNYKIGAIVLWILLIVGALIVAIFKADMSSLRGSLWIIFAAIIMYLMYRSGLNRFYRRENEILEQLRELVEKK